MTAVTINPPYQPLIIPVLTFSNSYFTPFLSLSLSLSDPNPFLGVSRPQKSSFFVFRRISVNLCLKSGPCDSVDLFP